jgi:hypothetical protein
VPRAAVPDNLKAGITKPSRYEPGVNRTYQDLADAHRTGTRAARAKDEQSARRIPTNCPQRCGTKTEARGPAPPARRRR